VWAVVGDLDGAADEGALDHDRQDAGCGEEQAGGDEQPRDDRGDDDAVEGADHEPAGDAEQGRGGVRVEASAVSLQRGDFRHARRITRLETTPRIQPPTPLFYHIGKI
jgi:hypothetical protein